MKSRDLFEVLLEQLKIEDEDILSQLEDVEIEKVDVLADSRQMHFYLKKDKRMHPDVFQIFMNAIIDAFSDICDVGVWWNFNEGSTLEGEDLFNYFIAVYSVLAKKKPYIRNWLTPANYSMPNDNEIEVGLKSKQILERLEDANKALIDRALEQAMLTNLKLTYYVDEELEKQEIENAAIRKQEEDEKNILEALEAKEKREKEATVAESDVKPIGKDIPNGPIITIKELPDQPYRQIIEGYIFDLDILEFKTGNQLLTLKITDYTSSVAVKVFSGRNVTKEQLAQFKKGEWIRLEGDLIHDNYSNELDFRPRSIRKIKKAKRKDLAEGEKRVELHMHSNMSTMDATNSVSDLIEQAHEWGHPAVAITDTANVQAFPEAYQTGKKLGIKVIFGMEAYVVNDGELIAYNPKDIDLEDATYVVFDVETTGLSSVYDSIIELAGVKMKNGEVIDKFEAFINPGHPLSAFTTELTGITDAMLEGAPSEEKVMKDFAEFTEDTILVAHNASFDIGFIEAAYKKHDIDACGKPVIDTLVLSRLVNPQMRSHRLNTLAKHYNVELTQHHRAIYDAEATGFVFYNLLKQAFEDYDIKNHLDFNEHVGKDDAYKQGFPYMVTLIAKNQDGLKDLFKLVSESNINYFYRTPRIPRSVLNQYSDNLLLGTADKDGEVFTAMMQKGYDEAQKLVQVYDYIEIQPKSVYEPLIKDETISDPASLEHIMKEMVRLGEENNIPVVATGDVHYLNEEDAIYREIILKSMKHNANRELHLPKAHFRTTDEMLEEFSFLGEEKAYEIVVTNSQKIADMVDEIQVIKDKLYTPKIEGSDDEIREYSYTRAKELYGDPLPKLVEDRIKKELDSIISNGFSVIYLVSQKLVHKSNEDGYLVGSRGSVGSSLVATLTGITEVNPLVPHYYCPDCQYNHFFTEGEYGSGFDLPEKDCPECGSKLKGDGHDIPFETFLGFHGDKVPDIDLNFSGEYQPRAHAYTKVLFGEDHVYRAGTISTVAERTAFGYVRGYLEATDQKVPAAERERLAKGVEGVKRTTGQHPGGIIVIPSDMDVYDFTPIQYPADDLSSEWRTTHFDFHSIEDNVLKLDILGHDDPTMIRKLQDLSGIDPKDIPLNDPDVMSLFTGTEALGVTPEQIFSETGTLGVPEFGTSFVRGMLVESRPKTFSDLLQISGLSHGTDVWLGNAQDLIRNNIVELSDVIGCRDDIMTTLIQYGLDDSLAFQIMEHVRKGRGIPDEWQEEMRKHDVPEWYIESCLKIKYMFPKAHAAAYVMMALRVAYFKVHYPIYYYAAYFSVRAQSFDIIAMYQGKESVKRRIREFQAKGMDMSVTDRSLLTVLEVANEMLERGYSFQMVDIDKSDSTDFLIEGDTLIPPFRSIPGLGLEVSKKVIEARSENPFISIEDLRRRSGLSKTVIEFMQEHGILKDMPEENQLTLF